MADPEDRTSLDELLDPLIGVRGRDELDLDDIFDQLIRGHDPTTLRAAARGRLDDLRGPVGDMALRLIEAFGDEGDRRALARALEAQPDLGLDRAWQALSLLEAAGELEDYPGLVERWEEFADLGELDALLGELAEVMGDDHEPPGPGVDPIRPVGTGLAPVARGPRLRRCLATAVDAEGRATIALAVEDGPNHLGARFACDVVAGITDVSGLGEGRAAIDASMDELASRPVPDAVEDRPDLALALLAGCLGVGAAEGVRGWLDLLIGTEFGPMPLLGWSEAEAAGIGPAIDPMDAAEAVLGAAGWVDDSPLAVELADEIALREGDVAPDPTRDAGVFRYLFEHRLLGRVELYRRSLLWMSAFWSAAGSAELARGAASLALDLDDAGKIVAGQPFFVRLSMRSLAAASGRG